jgi:hypothetical protein
MRQNAQYIFLTIKAKNGEILNTLKVTRSVRDVVEKYVMQRRILMIVIAARRVTTRIIGNPAAVLSAPRKSLFLSKMQVMLFLTVYLHLLLRQTQRKKKNIL